MRATLLYLLLAAPVLAAEPVITAHPDGVTVDLQDFGQYLRVKLQVRELPGLPPRFAGFTATLLNGPGPDPGPLPPVPPPPPPPPVPGPPPAGEFGIAPEIYRLALAVQAPNRKADCLKLADQSDAIAKRIKDLKDKGTVADINKALVDIVGTLNSLDAGWDGLKSQAGVKLKEIVTREKLPTSGDLTRWGTLFSEVAQGFRYAQAAMKE